MPGYYKPAAAAWVLNFSTARHILNLHRNFETLAFDAITSGCLLRGKKFYARKEVINLPGKNIEYMAAAVRWHVADQHWMVHWRGREAGVIRRASPPRRR